MKNSVIVFCSLIISACSLAPQYHRPAMPIPLAYKEKNTWCPAITQRNAFCRRPWWEWYGDATLNALEERVLPANQNLKAAFARYEQARADLAVARSAFFPNIVGIGNSFRQQTSGNIANKPTVSLYSDNLLAFNLHYEIDVWGRIRNSVVAAKSLMQASAYDFAAMNLSLHAELANTYFLLRGADQAQRILDKTVIAYQQALDLTVRRHKGGVVSVIDVDQAQNQLETAKTAAADMHLKRAQLEHGIAVLIGAPPALFCLKSVVAKPKWVTITPDLPSTLLERRPDIAEAEMLVKAANANIGVARAAFFPSVNFSLSGGLESATLANLISSPSLIWSLGPTTASALLNNGSMPFLTQTLFDGGRIRALSYQAQAKYHETVANYRETVLRAFQEVEDQLVALRQLDQENTTQTAATLAANRALKQAMYRYQGGLTTYLDVIIAQNIALQAELSTTDIHTRRQVSSVQLIKAIGGGWWTYPAKCI